MDDEKKTITLTPSQASALWLLVGDKVVELLDRTQEMRTPEESDMLEESISYYRDLMGILAERSANSQPNKVH